MSNLQQIPHHQVPAPPERHVVKPVHPAYVLPAPATAENETPCSLGVVTVIVFSVLRLNQKALRLGNIRIEPHPNQVPRTQYYRTVRLQRITEVTLFVNP